MSCRQLHEETIRLYYGRNRFYFAYFHYSTDLHKLFLSLLKDDYANLLTHVIFEIPKGGFSQNRKYSTMSCFGDIMSWLVGHGSTTGFASLRAQCLFDPTLRRSPRLAYTPPFDVTLALSNDEDAIRTNHWEVAPTTDRAQAYWFNAGFKEGDGCRFIRLEIWKSLLERSNGG